MQLCEICNSANGNAFQLAEGKCYVCDGKAVKTKEMIVAAISLLGKEAANSFSISTLIPKDWLSREEKAWDMRSKGAESIKNYFNRMIISAIRDASNLTYSNDGDCKLVFDYSTGEVAVHRNELFIFGRYCKLAAGLSQSRWTCPKCEGKGCKNCEGKGKYYESVEERIGEPFKALSGAIGYVMHASGREDVDATNTAGRGFVLELQAPEIRKIDLAAAAEAIAKSGEVSVQDLRVVPRSFSEVVTESHFDKSYSAFTEFGRALTQEDVAKIRSIEGQTLLQNTPTRVAHRRAILVRHRKVKQINVSNVKENTAVITVMAEAGTYIKELISGDNGRTVPSVAGLLGTSAVCKKLEVTKIEDGFLDLFA